MKRPIIEDDLAKRVQAYANKNCDGNFTQAVSELVDHALLSYLKDQDIKQPGNCWWDKHR